MTDDSSFDLGSFLPYLLNRAAEESSAEFARIYKSRYGLLRTEWRVLFHLGQTGKMTATDISKASKIHKTKISRAVSGLEKRRYLRKDRKKDDRRSEILTLTPTGLSVFKALSEVASSYNTELLETIPEKERGLLLGYLRGFI